MSHFVACICEPCRETSPPKFSSAGRKRCRAADRPTHRFRASLSSAAGESCCRLCSRRRCRHYSTSRRPMARGAARPAIHHREPAGRGQQHRHRGGRARVRRRIHAAHGRELERDQRDALRQPQFQFYPRYRAGRERHPISLRHGGKPVGSGQVGSRVHRLCQGQSPQTQHGLARHR